MGRDRGKREVETFIKTPSDKHGYRQRIGEIEIWIEIEVRHRWAKMDV